MNCCFRLRGAPGSAWRAFILAVPLLLGLFEARGAHPHLFYSSSDVSTLQSKKSDAAYADIFNEIKIDCRSRYGPSSTINTTTPDKRYWQAIRSHATLLMLDPVTASDSRYQCATQFTKYFNAVLNAPGWTDFFGGNEVDTPFYLAALVIGYDMNYPSFSASARQDLITKLADRADYLANTMTTLDIPADMTDYRNTNKVLRNKFVMAFSALGLIAYGLQGEVTETRRQGWLTEVNNCLAAWSAKAMADGVSLEGYSYHELMVELLFLFLEARTRATGVNQFTLYPAATQHPLYSMYSWIPGGERNFVAPMPWGDTQPDVPADMRTNVAALVKRLKSGSTLGLARLANWMQFRSLGGSPNNSYSRVDPSHYFSIDDSVTMQSPPTLGLPPWHFFPNSGVFVWRSGWDFSATWFSLACSPQLGGHEAPEAGSFVIFKGGAPYIAPHFYLANHRTQDHNVMMIDGQGQSGEDLSSISTVPQPPAKWPQVQAVLGDDSFFYARLNLKPCYASTRLVRYTREFVGFADCFVVRDSTTCSASVSHEFLLHAYKSTQPEMSATAALNPDSDPASNPWSGSGATWTLTPRSSGPYTGAMTFYDLSPQTWTRTITPDMVNAGAGEKHRGYKLSLKLTATNATALTGYVFPGNGTLAKWTGSGGEGVRFMDGGTSRGVMVWTSTGSVNASEVNLQGTVGGIHTGRGWLWGYNLTQFTFNKTQYLVATAPMSLFTNALVDSGARILVLAPTGGRLSLKMSHPVREVWLNGAKLAMPQWSLSGGMLHVTLYPMRSAGKIELVYGTNADPAWLSQH